MQTSFLQLKDYCFSRVNIAAREEFEIGKPVSSLDFNGVTLGADIGFGCAVGQENDPVDYLIKLRVHVDNAKGKPIPYDVDVEVIGTFSIAKSIKAADRNDLALVNGVSMLYGSIRELVAQITGRNPLGKIMLPSVTFLDHRINRQASQVEQPEKGTDRSAGRRGRKAAAARKRRRGRKLDP